MMDKRKLKITTSHDGKTTTIRNKYGSGYNKESILLNTSTVTDDWNDAVFCPNEVTELSNEAVLALKDAVSAPNESNFNSLAHCRNCSRFFLASLFRLLFCHIS